MKHYFISSLCMLLITLMHGVSFSQQGNTWTFGVNARVNFDGTNPPTVGTSSLSSYEGCASMSDNAGNLIFYTDGITVWDNTNTVVPGVLNGHWSSAQSGIIVPEPGLTPGSTTGRYYIFSVPQLASGQVQHTIYNSGTNLLSNLNTPMPDNGTALNTTESITVARHCNGIDYWVITHEAANSNRFKAYLVTNASLAMPVSSLVGPIVPSGSGEINSACNMKVSPNNNRLAFIVRQTSVNLFDFNPSTGVISNPVNVVTGVGRSYYGVEFSPNSNVLYYTDVLAGLFAYNILAPATRTLANAFATTNNLYAGLQLAPNGLIYMAKDGDSNMGNLNQTTLGRIDTPDSYLGSTYTVNGLTLAAGTGVKCGLPNVIPSFINPQLDITASDSVICSGTSTTLTATGNANGAYTWSPATGLNTTTGSVVIASPTSDQTYIVSSTVNGCTTTQQITINVENCCFAAVDPVFTPITSDPYFTTHTVLSGKYYVAPGVVITVDATTLDMTNVDMVFDECAGINFVNGAQAIAYNSVFRTCDELTSWLGFSFSGSNGNISESTFKNAQKAIKLEKTSNVRITNNNFLNNQISVYLNINALSEAISGNEFTINNVGVNYETCENTFGNSDAFGIWARRGTFRDVISQNNFVNADFSNTKRVYGVYLTETSSSANITANSFTNQYTSVYVSQGSRITVQNNTVELTNLYSYPGLPGQDIQIYFLNASNNCTISGNTLKGRPLYSNFGIYSDGNSVISITGNNLRHFRTCIQTVNSTSIDVINNTMENAGIGIYSLDNRTSYFGCNIINCLEDNSTGISFVQTFNTQSGCRIVGNCIYNTYTALSLNKGTATGTGTMPLILNNFLYSYRNFGVLNTNFNGPIGTGLTGTTAGKNTFASNNVAGGVTDISSNTPLASVGNFGVTNVNANVTLTGNNTFYSTTACGSQLGNATTQFSSNDLCQNITGDQGMMQAVIEHGVLKAGFETELDQLGHEEKLNTLIHVASELSASTNSTDMNRLHVYVNR